jgi:hypothetical protein
MTRDVFIQAPPEVGVVRAQDIVYRLGTLRHCSGRAVVRRDEAGQPDEPSSRLLRDFFADVP